MVPETAEAKIKSLVMVNYPKTVAKYLKRLIRIGRTKSISRYQPKRNCYPKTVTSKIFRETVSERGKLIRKYLRDPFKNKKQMGSPKQLFYHAVLNYPEKNKNLTFKQNYLIKTLLQ
jgi:hypothetical protein